MNRRLSNDYKVNFANPVTTFDLTTRLLPLSSCSKRNSTPKPRRLKTRPNLLLNINLKAFIDPIKQQTDCCQQEPKYSFDSSITQARD